MKLNKTVGFFLALAIWLAVLITGAMGLFGSIGTNASTHDKIGSAVAMAVAMYYLFRGSGSNFMPGLSPWDYVD